MIQPHIRRLAATQDICGEGCVWHPQQNAVYWTDINRRLLHRCLLASGSIESWAFDQPVTAVALTTDQNLLALILGGRIVLWDSRTHQETDILFRLPGWPALRCNDARVDPAGVLWFGTMQNNVQPDGSTAQVTAWEGALYSLASGSEAKQWQSGFGIVNTLAWSPNCETMYFGDTLANCLYRGSFDPVRSLLANREVFFADFPRGLPDGSSIDAEGYLWNCRFGGACIVRIAPDGSIAGIIETPVRNPTTCAFAASDASTLLFTSAADAAQPNELEGSLFSFETSVRGTFSTPLRL
ncbi:senescence marker protein-30 (SMP-30) family protein [Edaphobacter acidisoli]|uniref:Senescence marker protein-30 (SMP-30) family protein n=1 Tax=Edaphobacter acidisoli TaxID=2040573 RepID=A0A916RDH8_9BACT|nr:SMP-30/gluconolactonase/LRE family protein [Edaphobacter acidisoli]GGA53780.1 senescence marker protein-30 (SMP-30) family protein [Edaphobacter acidisoli]